MSSDKQWTLEEAKAGRKEESNQARAPNIRPRTMTLRAWGQRALRWVRDREDTSSKPEEGTLTCRGMLEADCPPRSKRQ